MTQRADLPDLNTLNPEALKALIVAQHEQLLSKDQQLLHKDEQLTSRDEEIERLESAYCEAAPDGIRTQVGKVELGDRAIRVEARRTGSEPSAAGSGFPVSKSSVGGESDDET